MVREGKLFLHHTVSYKEERLSTGSLINPQSERTNYFYIIMLVIKRRGCPLAP
jgi:hypothetical protein